jgi:outer membrane lipoprotein-sorting protein
MKSFNPPNPAGSFCVPQPPADADQRPSPGSRPPSPTRPSNRVSAWLTAPLALAFALSLTGCTHIYKVNRTVSVPQILDATLEELKTRIASQYDSIQSINATVSIVATQGGQHSGQVKEEPAFAGYILMRKPADLRAMMLLPVIRSLALDMVSDGKSFKLVSPPKNMAREGSEEVTTPSKNGLENLRPNIIREALLVPAILPDEWVTLTENSRIQPPASGKKEAVEEPDYDLTVLRAKNDHVLERVRVIHIGRSDLQPYQQDIYDHQGRIVTVVMYSRFQKFGDITFPTGILIKRPLDEYTLNIDIGKLTLNQKLDDEQFALKIPDSIPIKKM